MRRVSLACLFLYCAVPLLHAQQVADTISDSTRAVRAQRDSARSHDLPPLSVGARFSDLLVARALGSGLHVAPAGGEIGSAGRIRMRGPQTLFGERTPLVLLDGMRLDAASDAWGGPDLLEQLNPEEIASVEIIPGSADAAQYGPGAANGVIVVRTREGQSGPPRWDTFVEVGTRRPFRGWASDYFGVDRDNPDSAYRTDRCFLLAQAGGFCVQDSTFQAARYPYADQLRTAVDRQYGLSVSGGSRSVDYFVSGENSGDGGLFALSGDEMDRLKSLAQPVREWTRYPEWGGGARYRANVRARPGPGLTLGLRGARMTDASRAPTVSYFGAPGREVSPGELFQIENTHALGGWLGTADAEYRPTPSVTLRAAVGRDESRSTSQMLQRAGEGPQLGMSPSVGFLRADTTWVKVRTLSASAAFDWGSPRGAMLRTILGYDRITLRRDSSAATAMIDSSGFSPSSGWYREARWARSRGLYVQQHVDVRGRLAVTAVLRRDSFRYGPKPEWARGVAVAWLARPSPAGAIGSLRLRAALGTAPRQPSFVGVERTKELSAGADGVLLSGRLAFSVRAYGMRSDVSQARAFATSTGYFFTYAPGAAIENRGIEAALSSAVIDRPTVRWDARLAVWGNRNRLVKLGAPFIGITQRDVEGYPVGGYWGTPIQGFNDANNDGIIAYGEVFGSQTPVWMGSAHPTQGASLVSEVMVRRSLHFGAMLEYAAGHSLYNAAEYSSCSWRRCRAAVDPSTPLAEQANAALAGGGIPGGFFEDADFLKVREVWLGADLPAAAAAALHARRASVELVGRNLHTWTGYSGVDPEATASGVPLGSSEQILDNMQAPALARWSLRVRLSY